MSLYTQVKKTLNESGCRPRKRFGQNFLVDRNILDYIVKSINPKSQDTVIEIGAGTGILTFELSESPANVIPIEIDEGLFEILNTRFADKDNVKLIKGDILTINLSDIVELNSIPHQNPIKVVGNLPYYITTPILMKILDESSSLPIKEMLVMVQKEVGERIAASPGTKEYGALSVAIAYRAETKVIKTVSASSFYPKPRVDSIIIKINIKSEPSVKLHDENLFFKVINSAFQHRRKTLRNSLMLSVDSNLLDVKKYILDKALEENKIDARRRGETLSCSEFAELTNTISRLILSI